MAPSQARSSWRTSISSPANGRSSPASFSASHNCARIANMRPGMLERRNLSEAISAPSSACSSLSVRKSMPVSTSVVLDVGLRAHRRSRSRLRLRCGWRGRHRHRAARRAQGGGRCAHSSPPAACARRARPPWRRSRVPARRCGRRRSPDRLLEGVALRVLLAPRRPAAPRCARRAWRSPPQDPQCACPAARSCARRTRRAARRGWRASRPPAPRAPRAHRSRPRWA